MPSTKNLQVELAKVVNKKSPISCPDCGAQMLYKQNHTNLSFFLGCGRFPDCKRTMEIPESLKMQLLGYQQLPGFEP